MKPIDCLLAALTFLACIHSLSFAKPITDPEADDSAAPAAQYLRLWSSVEMWTLRLEQQPSLLLKPSHRIHAPNTLEIDLTQQFQTLQGFGGAITEAAAVTISKLPNNLVEEILDAYYGPNGHRYSLARLHINSCDFSLGSYSFDDVDGDFDLQHFDHDVKRDNETIIPFVKRALQASEGRLAFLASPWSPPAWLKQNNAMTGSDKPCLKEGSKYAQTWADYYVAWIQAYQKHGIEISAITVQNEPEFAAPWEACVYTPAEQREFVENFLAPTLHAAFPKLEILGYDHNKDHVKVWADEMLSTSKARNSLYGLAVHWYSGDSFDLLEKVHSAFPSTSLVATEACNCPGVRMNAWDRAEKYAHDIIGDLNNWVEAWFDWNIVLNHEGGPNHLGNLCDAHVLIRDDWGDQPALHFQPSYYVVGHFTRFLPRGSVRIGHRLTNPNGNGQIHHIGRDHGDLGAATVSSPQSANIASENTNIEVFTAISPKRISAHLRLDTDDEESQEVVIILFNPSSQEETVKVLCAKDQAVSVLVPAHSIHTLVGSKALFQ